ncbi:MAG: FAD-dependent oxidoreductase [Candidatus Aminicenantes bacterium]|nr:FAD-dependent oxidoreductase [Candidatus Aminicenantes bacterium]
MKDVQQVIKNRETDVLIIGAGPAGLTAGLYTARAGKKTIVLEGRATSRLDLGYNIENYPGFISIDSRELRNKFKKHAEHFGAEIVPGDVLDFNLNCDPKMITTRDMFIQAKTVILATGKPMSKGKMIPGEEKLIGLGVSYCSTCDGPLYRDRQVLALGNSDEAVEDVLALSQMNCQIVWISGDHEEFIFSERNQQVLKDKNIEFRSRTVLKRIVGEQKVEKAVLERDDTEEEIMFDGIFIFRDIPTAPLFTKAGIALDHRQCVKTDRSQGTNIDGVFAAGDLTCGGMQVVSAAGEGCLAALQAIKYIRALR